MTWENSADVAPNARPTVNTPAARFQDPNAGRPTAVSPRPRINPIDRFASSTTARPDVIGANRPTTPERSISARPVSSSVRRCSVTSSTDMIATAIIVIPAISLATIAPSV